MQPFYILPYLSTGIIVLRLLTNKRKMYYTLQTIYNIVKSDTDPTTYPCTFRDIILNSSIDTAVIQQHLDSLANEGLLLVKKLDCTVFCITALGIAQLQTFESQKQFPAPQL